MALRGSILKFTEEYKIQKLEDVVIQSKNRISTSIKNIEKFNYSTHPFDKLVMEFFNDLSINLLKLKKTYPEIVSFAFWCRVANLQKMKKKYLDSHHRLGRGILLHIAPSNVAINFAYSFAIGLISGNSNIVRIGENSNPVSEIVLEGINKILNKKKYFKIKKSNCFVFFPKDSNFTKEISGRCDARIIWGGDKTVQELKRIETPPRCVDVMFSDRYSMSIINLKDDMDLTTIANKFYNDTYIMNQNACSSPHVVFWYKTKKNLIDNFWLVFSQIVKSKFKISDSLAIEKFLNLCENPIKFRGIKLYKNYGNYLYVSSLKKIPKDIENLRGVSGNFYQNNIKNLFFLKKIINTKFQTVTYHGINPELVRRKISSYSLKGIDRIVPVGDALKIDIHWDGYDLINYLTRIINLS